MVPQHDPHFSADWAAHQAERAESIRAEQKRLSDHYENLTKHSKKIARTPKSDLARPQ